MTALDGVPDRASPMPVAGFDMREHLFTFVERGGHGRMRARGETDPKFVHSDNHDNHPDELQHIHGEVIP